VEHIQSANFVALYPKKGSGNEISDSGCLCVFRPLDAKFLEGQPVDLSSTMRLERVFQIDNRGLVSQSFHEI
jgi:hypothetical protein